ncbi:hypothetical protein cypCar_00015322 [Cyprinus carpio]|nr:hypothetical protein cypCar_00015322 [Cyprinus carpio]
MWPVSAVTLRSTTKTSSSCKKTSVRFTSMFWPSPATSSASKSPAAIKRSTALCGESTGFLFPSSARSLWLE